MQHAPCIVCGTTELSAFRDGRHKCKKCSDLNRIERLNNSTKLCRCCGVEKPYHEFEPKKQFCKTCNPDPDVEGIKRCTTCHSIKLVSEFHKHLNGAGGVTAACKECVSSVIAKRKSNFNLESVDRSGTKVCDYCGTEKPKADFYIKIGSAKGVHNRCKECCKSLVAEYRRENPDVIKETAKRCRERNRDRIRAQVKKRYAKNRDARLEYARLWRIKNNERAKEFDREKYRKYKTKYKGYRDNRRARIRNADGYYCTSDIDSLYLRQNGKCVYCDKDLGEGYHIDHIMPLSRGGSNWPSNLQLLCATCNLRKLNKLPEEYESQIGFDRAAWEATRGLFS